ncbi:MAG: DUF362 domain-containing protein [Promethearchaeota archaeon]
MKAEVYFFTAHSQSYKESMSKVKGPLALEKIGIKNKIKKDNKIVIKTHFGALENTRYLRPSYIRFLCDYVKELGAIPSVAESCGWGLPEDISGVHTEYSGRANEEEYLKVALMHGFTLETMGAPILMLDGSNGIDYEIQPIDGNLLKKVFVAGRLREFDYMILATHFKGHLGAGFGGALKNLGIGCVAKGQKIRAHLGTMFDYDLSKCIEDCDKCITVCPTGALSKSGNNILKKDWDKCRYCYMCRSICDKGVINTGSTTTEDFIYRFIDNAKGVVDYFGKKKIFYINYAIDITWQCDCGSSDVPFIPDIGVLSSMDPVALDQACIDLAHGSLKSPNSILSEVKNLPINESYDWFSYIPRFTSGELDLNFEGKQSKSWEIQLKAAEKIGLGSRDYNLIQVKIENNT